MISSSSIGWILELYYQISTPFPDPVSKPELNLIPEPLLRPESKLRPGNRLYHDPRPDREPRLIQDYDKSKEDIFNQFVHNFTVSSCCWINGQKYYDIEQDILDKSVSSSLNLDLSPGQGHKRFVRVQTIAFVNKEASIPMLEPRTEPQTWTEAWRESRLSLFSPGVKDRLGVTSEDRSEQKAGYGIDTSLGPCSSQIWLLLWPIVVCFVCVKIGRRMCYVPSPRPVGKTDNNINVKNSINIDKNGLNPGNKIPVVMTLVRPAVTSCDLTEPFVSTETRYLGNDQGSSSSSGSPRGVADLDLDLNLNYRAVSPDVSLKKGSNRGLDQGILGLSMGREGMVKMEKERNRQDHVITISLRSFSSDEEFY
jgi:hypothetical protein